MAYVGAIDDNAMEEARETMKYVENAETIDGMSVDAMDVALGNAPAQPEARAQMSKMIFGEEKLKMRIVTPDANTMLLTFGGAKAFDPVASIDIARIKYKGNYDPEPLAWKHLAIWMGNNHRIKLNVAAPMDISKLDAKKWPIAAMTGTGTLELSPEERTALKQYFNAGGKLIIDSCGGDSKFARSIPQVIGPLVESGRRGVLADHVVLNGPAKIKRVYYRRSLSRRLGADRAQPFISAILRDNKPIVIYSTYDLTTGLAGYEGFSMLGYKPQSALAVMTNLICDAAGVKPAPEAADQSQITK